jgi:hypothetical protein
MLLLGLSMQPEISSYGEKPPMGLESFGDPLIDNIYNQFSRGAAGELYNESGDISLTLDDLVRILNHEIFSEQGNVGNPRKKDAIKDNSEMLMEIARRKQNRYI